MIDRNNYEAFFLDFHEGTLDEEVRREVLAFVDANPDLEHEFAGFEIISLDNEAAAYAGKENLKRHSITPHNYKTWFVAALENDLSQEGKREVEQFVEKNPGYKAELGLMNLVKVVPDYSVKFENKSALKKGGRVIPLWARIAAAACLVMGLAYFGMQQMSNNELVAVDQPRIPSVPLHEPVSEKIKVVQEEMKDALKSKNFAANTEKQLKRNTVERIAEAASPVKDSVPAVPVEGNFASDVPADADPDQSVIVINESRKPDAGGTGKIVVFDDADLAELGLKEKPEAVSQSILADAVNGVGKLFGVNAHYDKKRNPLQSKFKETLALGPLAITRTVSR
jgi:hypothetical protein